MPKSINKNQKKEVVEAITSIAKDIAKSNTTPQDTPQEIKTKQRQAEIMLLSLCEMYRIAHL